MASVFSSLSRLLILTRLLLFFYLSINQAEAQYDAAKLVSHGSAAAATPGNNTSAFCAISANGRYIVFESTATNLVAGVASGQSQIYIYDQNTGLNSLVSARGGTTSTPGNAGSFAPSISSTGRFVAFYSTATNLDPLTSTSGSMIFVRDLQLNTTAVVVNPSAAGTYTYPSISSDGNKVAYLANVAPDVVRVYLSDRLANTATQVSGGSQPSNFGLPGISQNGRYVVFGSASETLVVGDNNTKTDVFVYDSQAVTTERVSIPPAGGQFTHDSVSTGPGSISSDGRYVAFAVADTSDYPASQVYIRDRQTAATALVSQNQLSAVSPDDQSMDIRISDDAQKAVFFSYATNLINGSTDFGTFLLDRSAPAATAMSKVLADSSVFTSTSPCINAGGNSIGFHNDNTQQVYVRNLDLCPSDPAKLSPGLCGCGIADTDSDSDGAPDCAELCDDDPSSQSNTECRPISPVYVPWNGFLRMINILELINSGDVSRDVTVTLFDSSGVQQSQQIIPLGPKSEFDVIVNDLQGFSADSLGMVKVEFSSTDIDGRMFFYRTIDSFSSYEFAFGVPFGNSIKGSSAVAFNTYNPSTNPASSADSVLNWLSVINLDQSSAKSFTVNRYSLAGQFLSSSSINVPAFGRIDIDGGHGEGPSVVGFNEIVPADSSAPYLAQLIRYGQHGASNYKFAFPLSANQGGDQLFVPISSGAGGQNWLELQNVSDSPSTTGVKVYDNAGNTLSDTVVTLAARSGQHIEASSLLSSGQSGAVVIDADHQAMIAQSMFYFRDGAGDIQAMYGSQAGPARGGTRWGSYNLYLGMYNWLRIFNPDSSTVSVDVDVYPPGGGTANHRTISIAAHSGTDLGLHESANYDTRADTYGIFKVTGSGVMTELLRLRGNIDFAAPTAVRR